MRKIIALLLTAAAFAGCYNDKYEDLYPTGPVGCDTTTVTYAADIKPLLDSKCNTSGCHNGSGSTSKNFTTYAGIQPHIPRLLGSVNWTPGFQAMPQGLPKLSPCEINKMTRWVNQGALNN